MSATNNQAELIDSLANALHHADDTNPDKTCPWPCTLDMSHVFVSEATNILHYLPDGWLQSLLAKAWRLGVDAVTYDGGSVTRAPTAPTHTGSSRDRLADHRRPGLRGVSPVAKEAKRAVKHIESINDIKEWK